MQELITTPESDTPRDTPPDPRVNERVSERGDERGMTTAEYTVGTLGACSIAAVLLQIAQTDWFGDVVKSLLSNIVGIAGF